MGKSSKHGKSGRTRKSHAEGRVGDQPVDVEIEEPTEAGSSTASETSTVRADYYPTDHASGRTWDLRSDGPDTGSAASDAGFSDFTASAYTYARDGGVYYSAPGYSYGRPYGLPMGTYTVYFDNGRTYFIPHTQPTLTEAYDRAYRRPCECGIGSPASQDHDEYCSMFVPPRQTDYDNSMCSCGLTVYHEARIHRPGCEYHAH